MNSPHPCGSPFGFARGRAMQKCSRHFRVGHQNSNERTSTGVRFFLRDDQRQSPVTSTLSPAIFLMSYAPFLLLATAPCIKRYNHTLSASAVLPLIRCSALMCCIHGPDRVMAITQSVINRDPEDFCLAGLAPCHPAVRNVFSKIIAKGFP